MPCRVGITTTPSERKKHWKNHVVGLNNWQDQYVGSKSDTQEQENIRKSNCHLHQRHRGTCHASPGGGNPKSIGWYVYEFDYIRER